MRGWLWCGGAGGGGRAGSRGRDSPALRPPHPRRLGLPSPVRALLWPPGPWGHSRMGSGCPGLPAPTLTTQEHPSPCRRSVSESYESGAGAGIAASWSPAGVRAWHPALRVPGKHPGRPTLHTVPPGQRLCAVTHPQTSGGGGWAAPGGPGRVRGLPGWGGRVPARRAQPPAQGPATRLPL